MYGRVCFACPSAAAYKPLPNEVSDLEPELITALGRLANRPCADSDGVFAPKTFRLSNMEASRRRSSTAAPTSTK
jgi:hypothetical protein